MEITDFNKVPEKIWKVSDGKKTAIATITWLLLRIIDWKFPDAIDTGTQSIILDIATVLGTIGVADKVRKWLTKNKNN